MKNLAAIAILMCFASLGCDPTILPTAIDIRPSSNGDSVPEYTFLPPEDSLVFRDSFDWGQTQRVAEYEPAPPPGPGPVDPGNPPPTRGPPALYYTMVYVRSPDHLIELDEMQAHVRALPLFEEEWSGVPDGPVKFPFIGDGDGIFVYAVMPGAMLNAIRAESLAGVPTYDAVLLRPPPAAAATDIGSLSYDFLKERGFDYDVDDIDRDALTPPWALLTDDAVEPEDGEFTPLRLGRRLRQFARRVRDLVRGTVDRARSTFAAIATLVRPDTTVTFSLLPMETDPDFGGSTPTSPQMRRAWGPTSGTPMNLTDTRYVVRQFRGMTIKRDQTDPTTGMASETVVTARTFRICAEAFSSAAEVERSVIWPVQVCSPDVTPTGPAMVSNVTVLDVDFNILMQAIDGYTFSQQVLGFTPRRAVIQTGPLNRIVARFNGGRSVALCGSRTSTAVAGILEGVLAAIPGLGVPLEVMLANDIAIIDDGVAPNTLADRGVPTHEYGHFVLCDLLAQISGSAFDSAWSEITLATLFGITEAASEPRALNEAFADWFNAQVAGSTNYVAGAGALPVFLGGGPNGRTSPAGGSQWYPDPSAVALGGGLEENYGAGIACTAAVFPGCQFSRSPTTPATDLEAISEMATLFQDLVDGGPPLATTPGGAALWVLPPLGTPFLPLLPTATGLTPMPDEPAQLTGRQFLAGFQLWAARATVAPFTRFTKERLFEAMTVVLRGSGLSDPQICRTYSLHTGLVCPASWLR